MLVKNLDKNMNHYHNTMLNYVQFGSNNKFNLFILNKMLDNGQITEGNKKDNWSLMKGRMTTLFDLILEPVLQVNVYGVGILEDQV